MVTGKERHRLWGSSRFILPHPSTGIRPRAMMFKDGIKPTQQRII